MKSVSSNTAVNPARSEASRRGWEKRRQTFGPSGEKEKAPQVMGVTVLADVRRENARAARQDDTWQLYSLALGFRTHPFDMPAEWPVSIRKIVFSLAERESRYFPPEEKKAALKLIIDNTEPANLPA